MSSKDSSEASTIGVTYQVLLPIISLIISVAALLNSWRDSRSAETGRLASARVVAMKLNTDFQDWPTAIATARLAIAKGLIASDFDSVLASNALKASFDSQWRPKLVVTPDDMAYLASGAPQVAERVGNCIAAAADLDRMANLSIESLNEYLSQKRTSNSEPKFSTSRALAQSSLSLFKENAGRAQEACVLASDALQSLAFPARMRGDWKQLVAYELMISELEKQQVSLDFDTPEEVDLRILDRPWKLHMKSALPTCAMKDGKSCGEQFQSQNGNGSAPHLPTQSTALSGDDA